MCMLDHAIYGCYAIELCAPTRYSPTMVPPHLVQRGCERASSELPTPMELPAPNHSGSRDVKRKSSFFLFFESFSHQLSQSYLNLSPLARSIINPDPSPGNPENRGFVTFAVTGRAAHMPPHTHFR